MNKKGSIAQNLTREVIYLVIMAFVVILLLLFLGLQKNGASVWSEYYAKELSKAIDLSHPGDEITIDVQKAVQIALSNKISVNENTNDIFHFQNNEMCVKLDPKEMSCYSYFNNVEISDSKLILPDNVLTFKIGAKK